MPYTIPAQGLTKANIDSPSSTTYKFMQPFKTKWGSLISMLRALQHYHWYNSVWDGKSYINEYLNGRKSFSYAEFNNALNFLNTNSSSYDAMWHTLGSVFDEYYYTECSSNTLYDGLDNNIVIEGVKQWRTAGFQFTAHRADNSKNATLWFEPRIDFVDKNGIRQEIIPWWDRINAGASMLSWNIPQHIYYRRQISDTYTGAVTYSAKYQFHHYSGNVSPTSECIVYERVSDTGYSFQTASNGNTTGAGSYIEHRLNYGQTASLILFDSSKIKNTAQTNTYTMQQNQNIIMYGGDGQKVKTMAPGDIVRFKCSVVIETQYGTPLQTATLHITLKG